jgi:hypothetical protein
MKNSENKELFQRVYLSALQIAVKLADTTNVICELGRGSGKTTRILAARLDRIQHAMPGSLIVLAAATYRDIFDNILPGCIEYFSETYERGIYFEFGKKPPAHFAQCHTLILNWKHTVSFAGGTIVQFASVDRPESVLGKNAAHLIVDELLRIKASIFMERFLPILRADRSKFGHSHYFMGLSGFTSTPNFETDEDWFIEYEKDMNPELIHCIQEIACETDRRLYKLEIARKTLDLKKIKKLESFISRWNERLSDFRRGQTFYCRASSLSNLKILGLDYIQNQLKTIKNKDILYASIFAIRKMKVENMFFARFGKQHLFDDGYDYAHIDHITAGQTIDDHCRHLRYYDPKLPLYAGYDAGPFSSIIFAQRKRAEKEFRVIKNIWVYHPEQQPELAHRINAFFSTARRKEIILHYDRAANQKDPEWKRYYPSYRENGVNDTDAVLLRKELAALGWTVHPMSVDQPTIFYSQHYRLLHLLFSKNSPAQYKILIDRNECEALVSSINHSPLKRHEGRIQLDKSSETKLPFEEQAFNSTQLASAFMYLLWGEYRHLLPDSDLNPDTPQGAGTYM